MAATAAAQPITFYDSGSCPYAHRTWLALEEKQLPYHTIKVDLKNKSKVSASGRDTRSRLLDRCAGDGAQGGASASQAQPACRSCDVRHDIAGV